jgi:acetyltransferase
MKALIHLAKAEGVQRVVANILPDNLEMQRICERAGFNLTRKLDESLVVAQIQL